jgi:hypothetical protein
VGLVLSGGGGKGAYQIGCWEGLRHAGFTEYTVISGTSVGALNAALIAMGDVDHAKNVWANLSEPQVLLTTSLRKLFVAVIVAITIGVVTLLELCLGAAFVFAVAWLLPAVVLTASSYKLVDGHETYDTGPIGTWITTHRWAAFGLGCYEVALVIALIFTLLDKSVLFGIGRLRAHAKPVALSVGRRLWFGSNSPLKRLIAKNVSLQALREAGAKVFATIAVETTVIDPYIANWFLKDGPDPQRPWRGQIQKLLSEPASWLKIVAEPVEISALETDEAMVEALSASAQLPLVFQPGKWVGKLSFDGRLAENTPVWPALEHCDLVFIVYLNPSVPPLDVVKSRVADMFYSAELLRMTPEEAQSVYSALRAKGKFEAPIPPVQYEKKRIILVAPSQPLGSTVDFSGGARVEGLMALGRQDMERALETAGIPSIETPWT